MTENHRHSRVKKPKITGILDSTVVGAWRVDVAQRAREIGPTRTRKVIKIGRVVARGVVLARVVVAWRLNFAICSCVKTTLNLITLTCVAGLIGAVDARAPVGAWT